VIGNELVGIQMKYLFCFFICTPAAAVAVETEPSTSPIEASQTSKTFNIQIRYGYNLFTAIELRISDHYSTAFENTVRNSGYSSIPFGTNSTSEKIYALSFSYWMSKPLSDDYAFTLSLGTLSEVTTDSTFGISRSSGSYAGIFAKRLWIWDNGLNLSFGIGYVNEAANRTSDSSPPTRTFFSYFNGEVGIGWAF
jgi:hypothetical protein